MTTNKKRMLYSGVAAAAVALTIAGTGFVYPAFAQTTTVAPTVATTLTSEQQPVYPGRGDRLGDQEAAFAEALGITVEELQAAQETASNAAIDQLVADGWLTEKQAEQLKARAADFGPGLDRAAVRFAGRFVDSEIDYDALLADALGIGVDELAEARTQVRDDALAQAVTDGRLTQEQADLMKARIALGAWLAPKLETAYTDLIAQAVTEGVITQEQADALEAQGGFGGHGLMGPGFGMGGDMDGGFGPGMGGHGMGGHGGRGGHGQDGMGQGRMGRGMPGFGDPNQQVQPDQQTQP
jgi:polyhydroxyalkanoate synthesis regulator phasin